MANQNEQSKGSSTPETQKPAQAAQQNPSVGQGQKTGTGYRDQDAGQSQASPGLKKDAAKDTDNEAQTASDAQAKSAPSKGSTGKMST